MTTFEIWERDQTTPGPPTKVADITEAWGRTFRLAKNDDGFCHLNVQLSDTAAVAAALPGRIVKAIRNGESYGFVLGPRQFTTLDRRGKKEEVLAVRALGGLAALNDGRVQPQVAPLWQPWGRQIPWDWTHTEIDVSSWTPAVELWQQGVSGDPSLTGSDVYSITWDQGRFPYNVPDGFVDGTAWMIHSSGYIGTGGTGGTGTLRMPVGVSLYHETFTVAEETRARILAGADDRLWVAVDGVMQLETGPMPEQGFARARSKDLILSPGQHTVRVKVENFTTLIEEGNISWLVLAIHEVNGETNAEGAVLVHTDSSWVCLDLPADLPGFTCGTTLLSTLAKIQAAGFLLDVVPTFDELEDTGGNEWPIVTDVVTAVGQGLGEVLKQLAEAHIDFRVNHDMTLDAWVKGQAGTASGVTYAAGVNIGHLEFEGDTTAVSSMLVLHEDGFEVVGDATAGRQEFVDLSSLPRAQAMSQATDLLDGMSSERWRATIAVVPTVDDVPLDDLNVFDTAAVPTPTAGTDEVECVAVTWSEDEAANEILEPEFGDLVLTVEERAHQAQARQSLGSLGGRVALLPVTVGSGVESPGGQSGGGFPPLSPHQPIPPFERDPDVTEATSWPYRFQVSGSLFEVGVLFAEAQGADVDVLIDIDGSTIATVTVTAGLVYATAGGLAVPVVKDITEMVVTCADLGFYLQVTPRVR